MSHLVSSIVAMSLATLSLAALPVKAFSAESSCKSLPSHADLKAALTAARQQKNGGLDTDMWGVIVDRGGIVCAVAYTGKDVGSQWLASRVIAGNKANTANALSLPGLALSTSNLWAGTQPGGSLFGLADSNQTNTAVAYKGDLSSYGSVQDPMVGERIGGIIVFGGGLALYDKTGALVGGIGVSGDTSCADHAIAWRTRAGLELDYVPNGVAKDKSDQIMYDVHLGKSSSGFGQATCMKDDDKIAKGLVKVRKVSKGG